MTTAAAMRLTLKFYGRHWSVPDMEAAIDAEIVPLVELLEICRDKITDEELWTDIDAAIKHTRGTL